MAAEKSGAGSGEPSAPARYVIDQDTTDEFMDRPVPVYASGSTPAQQRAHVDVILADAKAGKRTLPTVPPISEG